VRQKYAVPDDFTLFRIAVDDNDRTNIVRHFADCNASIRDALANGKGVLVHCQAGVSRSTTLVASFLMSELGLTVDGTLCSAPYAPPFYISLNLPRL
jgi:dual specificity phosphatase 12